MRRLIIVVLASSSFGGVIGALATAATQSQASPTAIAAAVQKVQDTHADAALNEIRGKIQDANGKLGQMTSELGTNPTFLGGQLIALLNRVTSQLHVVCANTSSSTGQTC
jgi:hypothetical protein